MKKVLVVDDREDVRMLASALLESCGYHTAEVANEDEAVALLQTMCPDIVVSDLDMNAQDGGLIVLHEVKRLYPDVPVLICSGDFTTPLGIEAELKKAGAGYLLQKPFKLAELKAALDSFKRPTIGNVLAWFLKTAGEIPSTEHCNEWMAATRILNECLRTAFGDNPLDLPPETELDSKSYQAFLVLQRVAEKWKQ